jgi:cell filamentation protein, protein adenylyltransferase
MDMSTTVTRGYVQSHPWINFEVDLRRASPDLWMLLGEARSKVDHLSRALLKPEVAQEMNTLYLAKGAHATTAIEGNTLSEDDVVELLEGRLETPPSQEYLAQEVMNIVNACNRIKDHLMAGGSANITSDDVRRFNREVLEGLELDDGVVPGEIRTGSVVVANYRGAPAEDCDFLLDRLCEWLAGHDFDPPSDHWRVPFALIKAVLAHLYLEWIHPFGDGNGRTGRLIELQILLAAGMPMPASHLLSNHYNETRSQYYRELDHASRSGGDVLPFLRYALQGFIDGIRAQLDKVWRQQYGDRWEQFIYETFGDTHTPAKERQRRLVLELSKLEEPVPRKELVRMSPELYEAYVGTERTLSRDLNALESMGLIERIRPGWRPRRERILAFQPLRRENEPPLPADIPE